MNLFMYICTDMATKNASCKAGTLLPLTLTILISIKPLQANMASVYYVTPNITACHENMTVCEELDTYAQNASKYFQPNSVFVLLTGTHLLTTELYVENSSNITINASSISYFISTQVLCTNSSALFSFSEVSNLILSGFMIANCGFNFFSSKKNSATFHPITFSNVVWENSVVNLNCCSLSSPSDLVIFNSYVSITSCDLQQYEVLISSTTMMVYQSTCSEFIITVSNSSTGIVQSNFSNGLIYLESSQLIVNGTHFTQPNVVAEQSTIFIHGVNNAFSSGIISQPNTAIKLISSVLNVAAQSNITFTGNYAPYGGALYLDSYSNISITLPTTVYFINNTAFVSGGAIYVEDTQSPDNQPSCFFQVNSANHTLTPSFIFEQNSAQLAGSVLYGGNIDNCIVNCDGLPPEYQSTCHKANSNISGIVFDAITTIGAQANQTEIISTISSDPCTVILCDNSSDTYSIYPGQNIYPSLQTVGQRNGACPTGLSIFETKYNNVLQFLQSGESCTIINISLNSFPLYVINEICIQPQTASCLSKNTVSVSVRYIPGCPSGFYLENNPTGVYCTCIALLINKGINCDLNNETITIQGPEWIGNLSTLGPQHDVIAFASVCPFDYCTNGRPINILLDTVGQNAQCSNNRRNVLCGECNDGLSASLGSSNCKKCSNHWLALLVVFAVMGVALVLFLFVTNLTVPTGTINGLIFYANVVRSNKDIFFSQSQGGFATFLQTFIAWMNLDFGIEVCFYDGMDNYAKAWLQFVFPTYILTLVGIFILIGRYSQAISYMCRYNAVPVVATLLYLSYAKLIQTTIIIFASATLELSDNKGWWYVWQYDGNIEYLGSKHAWLFVFGLLVTMGLIIPYTSLILLSPCLQSWSHRRYLMWVNKLKPFLDCYQAGFKDKYRYWIGVLLVVRIGLYIVFTLIQDSNTKLDVIITVVMLYTTVVCSLSVYKDWRGQTLEVFFMLNMIFLAQSSYQSKSTNGLVIQFLIASAFVCFIFMDLWQLSKRYLHLCKRIKNRNISSRTEEKHLCNAPAPYVTYGTRDKTLDMFREPLMDDDEQGD